MNINLEDDAPLWPNELLQPSPISCPCLSSTQGESSNEENQALETILNRNNADVLSSNDDRKINNHSFDFH